jgi:hypothetical protein
MVVSIGHTLEKETSVGIYRSRLAEWMVKESILTKHTIAGNYTTCTVDITTNDSDDSDRWQYIIKEQLFQASVTYTQAPHDFVVYKYLPTQVHLPLNARSND